MASLGVKADFKEDIQKVWEIATSVDKFETWRSDIKKVEILTESMFTEYTKDGYITNYRVIKKEPYGLFELEADNENLYGRMTIKIFERDGGVEFFMQQVLSAKKLIMVPFAKNYLKAFQMNYIEDLKKILK